jgi:hypothetical protein
MYERIVRFVTEDDNKATPSLIKGIKNMLKIKKMLP